MICEGGIEGLFNTHPRDYRAGSGLGYDTFMVAAVRQTVKVLSDGRIEIIAPEFRAGTVTEVIVLLPPELTPASPAERVAALARLRESIGLTTKAADNWVGEVRAERDAWNPPAEP